MANHGGIGFYNFCSITQVPFKNFTACTQVLKYDRIRDADFIQTWRVKLNRIGLQPCLQRRQVKFERRIVTVPAAISARPRPGSGRKIRRSLA